MSIKKIWGTRTKANAETHIGEKGSLFYDEATGVLRLSDGHTPGGVPVTINAVSIVTDNLLPGSDNTYGIGSELLRWNHIHLGDGGVYFDGAQSTPQTTAYLPGDIRQSLVPTSTAATLSLGSPSKRWSSLYIGGASIHMLDTTLQTDVALTVDNGTIFLNGAQNLAVGNLVIRDTTLQSLTTNLDINVGETNDSGDFNIKRKVVVTNTTFSDTEAMFSLNASGQSAPPTLFDNTIIGTVSRQNKNSRIVQRAYGATGTVGGDNSYNVFASYTSRGSISSPQPNIKDDILMRLSANGRGDTGWTAGGARVEVVATEDFSDTAKGTRINFWTTTKGQTGSHNVASIDDVGVIAKAVQFQSDIDLANNKKQTKAGIEWDQAGLSIATLDGSGRLSASQIPTALTGAIVFKGVWDAYNNVPELSNTKPTGLDTGWEYVVSVTGTRDIGDGSQLYTQGDFVIFDGTNWKVVRGANAFVSLASANSYITVSSATGAITLTLNATSASTNSALVTRDSNGSFSANIVTAALHGNADTATNATAAGKSTNLIDGVLGSVPYQNASDTTLFVAPNTTSTKKFFTQTGTGTVGAAPSWTTLAKGDVGLNNVDDTADANKNVLYAITAGGAPATDVYAWAKAATKPSYTKSEVGLSAVENTALSTSTYYIGTTQNTYGRASGAQSLSGISIDGNAGTVTNGVYTSGSYSDPSWLTISKSKVGLSSVENTALSTWPGTTNITTVGTLTSVASSGNISSTVSTVASSNKGAFSYGTLGYNDSGIMASYQSTGGSNGYNQITIQNTSNGATASANVVVTNNNGTSTTNYGEFGMNSSGWSGTGFNLPSAVYLNAESTDLIIGTTAAKTVQIFTNNTQAISIASTGVATFAQTITGSVSGNSGTVTNGVYTTGSYSDPSWLTISKSKVGLSAVENTALSTWAGSSSITTVGTLGSLSVTATITGSVSGNAGTVTNGVYTNGSYSDPSWLTISKSKVGLSAVENTALSTWAGTSNITTVGTLTSGTIGSGFTAIANARLANSTISGVALGGTLNALTAGTNIAFSSGTTYDGSAAITINFSSTVAVAGNSWTPTLIFATQGSQTYTAQYGNYVKNGRFVTCYFTISTSAQSGTGAMSIGGLPFTSATSTHGPVGNLQVTALTTGGGAGAIDFMGTGTVASASTTVPVYGFTVAAGGTFAAITGAELGTGTTSISGVIQYITAS